MLTSDLFENKTPAAWRAGYERGLRYYRQGPDNPYPAGSEEAKDYADGYHNGELDSYDKYDTSTMNEGAVKELSQDLRSMSDAEFLARYKMTKVQARAGMKSGVAESYPKHQDLSGISTDKLEAYLAKQSQQSVPGEGNQVKRVRAELQRRQQGLAEVSKATLDRYVPKAVDAHGHADFAARQSKDDPTLRSYHKSQAQTAEKRRQGISRALDRMSKTEGVAEGNNSSPFNQEQNLRSKNNNELAGLIQFWNRALEKNPDHKVAREQLGLIKMIRAERIGKKGVAETNVSKYKDLGATKNTTHFIKNVTTGKIVSPHRSLQDAQDALVGSERGSSDKFKIVRARKQGVAEDSLNEFAPGAGGDDEAGDDPYKYPKPKRYNRSADYFEQFEADHFDREDFDDDTGVFKGYWGNTQIAYFKFDNPARTGGNNPGMGWYYEPQTNNRGDNTAAAPAADDSAERKQQELSMINAFLKSGNRPNTDSQIGRLMKKHGVAEGLNDTQKKIEDTINKLENRLKHAKTDEQWDRIKDRIERLQAGLKRSKQGVAEGSGPKEKQKTPYRDINSPEYRAAADKQKQRMAKDKAAEPGKKMLAKQGVAEGLDKQALQKELIIINKLIKDMKNSWQQQHLLQKKQELLKQLKQGVAEGLEESYIIIRTDAEGKKDMFAKFSTYEKAQKELDGLLDHPLHTKYKQKFEIKRKGGEQGVAEEQLTEQDLAEAVSTLELADFLFKGLEQKFPKIIERYGHEVVGNAIMDVAEENLDVSSVSEVDMLIDDIIEKLQNYNGNDSGLRESTVSRLYYNVVGTSAPELRKDFGMRHDRRGWFLSESSGRNRIMDAQRAFGSPKLVEYSVSDATAGAAQLGPDNVVSPVGSVPKSQRINTKKARK